MSLNKKKASFTEEAGDVDFLEAFHNLLGEIMLLHGQFMIAATELGENSTAC